ncbi:hypothetical protein Adt_42156 [Abeliophyllum distichum]|uniref:Uncharacterized protein n=1 Tax=Abeliophyllum distichum TaxID=126358 RepID=A0ABD1PQW1_9LAMI
MWLAKITKSDADALKGHQSLYCMRRRSKKHRRNTSVKLVEIMKLSGSESNVDDDKVKRVVPKKEVEEGEKVEGDAMDTEDVKVKRVVRGESGGEIGNDGQAAVVESEMDNDGC